MPEILSTEAEQIFSEGSKPFAPNVKFMLRGIAATAEVGTSAERFGIWRPTANELAKILRAFPLEMQLKMLAAGAAFAAGLSIPEGCHAPRILMFASAVNCIGSAPNTELTDAIASASKLLKASEDRNNEALKIVLHAANERAQFDRVNEMLRVEFSAGLRTFGFPKEAIDQFVPIIVKAAAAARHSGLVERVTYYRHERTPIADPFYEFDDQEQVYGEADLIGENRAAKIGAAFSILSRLRPDVYGGTGQTVYVSKPSASGDA